MSQAERVWRFLSPVEWLERELRSGVRALVTVTRAPMALSC
jgi:hypothetical protein